MTIGGLKQQWKPLNANPGPGEHEASISLIRPKTQGIALSKSPVNRTEFILNKTTDTPAPSYNVMNTFGSNLK